MTIKVLIVDPDIAFAVPIKRALEMSGDYSVNVFANGKAAVELLQREAHDVAILDFGVSDIDLPSLIYSMRQVQSGLFILASPRTNEHIERLPMLDVQGSITKPYFARQLAPVIREALSAKQRLTKKERERRVDAAVQPESQTPPRELAAPRPASAEPPARPDDTFYRLIRALNQGDTGQSKPVQAAGGESAEPAESTAEEPLVAEGATIRDLVSGQPTSKPAEVPPQTVPESSQPAVSEDDDSASDLAVVALGAAADDTVPLEQLSVQSVIARADEETGKMRPLPRWMSQTPEEADQPTVVEPTVVEPPVTGEDTPASSRTPIERLRVPKKADDDLADQPTPPLTGLPAMLDEPSFVARVIDDAPPTAFPPTPAPGPAPAAEPELPPAAEPVARLAVQLTQLTVDSTAQATLLTRSGALLASAGQMPEQAINSIVDSINLVWQGAGAEGTALVRYINVTSLGDFLLYSIRTVEDMTLSMLFPAETSLRIIRHQARRLLQALEAVPEPPPTETWAAPTLPSRPTGMRAPEGMHEALMAEVEAASQAAAEAEAESAVPRIEGPYTAYAFVWLPRAGSLAPDVASMLLEWINAIALKHNWQVEGVEIQPTYTTIQVSIPANETPTTTVEALMRETAAHANNPELWADAYYIVAPGRAVTQQEIASFMEYRRDAQDAA